MAVNELDLCKIYAKFKANFVRFTSNSKQMRNIYSEFNATRSTPHKTSTPNSTQSYARSTLNSTQNHLISLPNSTQNYIRSKLGCLGRKC